LFEEIGIYQDSFVAKELLAFGEAFDEVLLGEVLELRGFG